MKTQTMRSLCQIGKKCPDLSRPVPTFLEPRKRTGHPMISSSELACPDLSHPILVCVQRETPLRICARGVSMPLLRVAKGRDGRDSSSVARRDGRAA